MAKAAKTRLLSFSMEDEPGLLAKVTTALASAKVNITTICAYAWDDTAYFDLTVDNTAKAKKALAGLTPDVEEEDVITIEMPNRVGEFQKAAKVVADAGINITYLYGTTSTGRTSTVLFSTSDNRKALRLINK